MKFYSDSRINGMGSIVRTFEMLLFVSIGCAVIICYIRTNQPEVQINRKCKYDFFELAATLAGNK